jgi:gliding motility-associated-like protein
LAIAQNLVPNPSFEDTISCPISLFQITQSCEHWINPVGSSSSDYYHRCSSNPWSRIPANEMGYQEPRTGDGMAGIIPLSAPVSNYPYFYSEFIQVQLNGPLQIGESYEFKMYLNLSNKSPSTTSSIGVLLSSFPINTPPSHTAIVANPQLANPLELFIADTLEWYLFTQTFIAEANYNYITIGNFNDPSNTPVQDTGIETDTLKYPYLYIDDVSLIQVEAIIDTICAGESITLVSQGSELTGWSNNFDPDQVISTDDTLTVYPLVTTTYYENNTDGIINHMIYVNDSMDLNIGRDTVLCYGDTLHLDLEHPYTSFLWHNGSDEPVLSTSEGGIVWVEIENGCGFISDTIVVSTDTLFFSLGADTLLCLDETLVLNPDVWVGDFIWQDGSTDPFLEVKPWDIPGEFYVEVRDSTSCGRDTIQIDYHREFAEEFLLQDETFFCEGSSINYVYSTPIAENYLWSNGSTSDTLVISSEGVYWLELSNRCFSETDTIVAIAKPTPFFELPDDTLVCGDPSFTMDIISIPNADRWWDGFSNSSSITVNQEGIYFANAYYNACEYRDSVRVSFIDCSIEFSAPNIFTPNADGKNDYFVISGENIEEVRVSIMDRWGRLLFQTNDLSKSWDGSTSSDEECSSGTYYYLVEGANQCCFNSMRGSLTLSR